MEPPKMIQTQMSYNAEYNILIVDIQALYTMRRYKMELVSHMQDNGV